MNRDSATHLYAIATKRASWGSFGWEASKFIPGVGAIPSFIDAGSALMRGRFGEALAHGVGGAAGLIVPGGGAIAKGLTGAGRLAMQAGAGAAAKGVAGRAAAGALTAGGKALTQAGTGAAKAIAAGNAANNAVAAGVQKVIPVAKNTTWMGNPARSAVNVAVRNPLQTASMVMPSAGGAATGAAAGAQPAMPPLPPAQGISSQPFRPRPMVNF